jgi:ABC-type transporter Mla subunit MlaD
MRTLFLILPVVFLSSVVSVAVAGRADPPASGARVVVPDRAIRNISSLLREQDNQTDRLERRLRRLQRDVDGLYDRFDAQGGSIQAIASALPGLETRLDRISSRVDGVANNVQDSLGLDLRYRGRPIWNMITCMYDAVLLSDKSCEGGP